MTTPGSNLLAQALTLIGQQTVGYYRWLSATTNDAGAVVPTFAAARAKRGSFQPVPRSYYLQMGLDYEKEYAMWWDPAAGVQDVARDRGADQIIFGCKRWEAVSVNDWTAVDKWSGTLFVALGPCV